MIKRFLIGAFAAVLLAAGMQTAIAQTANRALIPNAFIYHNGRTFTGATDTINDTDVSAMVRYTNAGAVAVTLGKASSGSGSLQYQAGWWSFVYNGGTAAAVTTITPTTSTINGAATLVLNSGQGALIQSDGTNYFAIVGMPNSAGGTLPVAGGGTGRSTLTTGAYVIGNGTTAVTLVGPCTTGQVALGSTGVAPVCGALPLTAMATQATDTLVANNTTGTAAPTAVAYDNLFLQSAGGRLTLTTLTPIMTTSVVGSTSIFYTPHIHNIVPISNGTNFIPTPFSELTNTTTDATKNPAAVANSSNYDLFVWNDAGTIRLGRGPLWTSGTARGAGAGTTELTLSKGIWVNANAITNGPGANLGTYVGTVRSNGTAGIDQNIGQVSGAGGSANGRMMVWNRYNQVLQCLTNLDTSATYPYTTATIRQKDNNANNSVNFVMGLPGTYIDAVNNQSADNSNATKVNAAIGIGYDSTTAFATGNTEGQFSIFTTIGPSSRMSTLKTQVVDIGVHFTAPLEFSAATGATSWYPNDTGNFGFTHCMMM